MDTFTKDDPIIRQIIDRDCHVGLSNRKVIRHVITRLKNGMRTYRAWPLELRRSLMIACIEHHKDNGHIYHAVMTGRF